MEFFYNIRPFSSGFSAPIPLRTMNTFGEMRQHNVLMNEAIPTSHKIMKVIGHQWVSSFFLNIWEVLSSS